MALLPESRRFGGASPTDPLAVLASNASATDAPNRASERLALRQAVQVCLERGDEVRLRQALAQCPGAASHRALSEALARTIDAPSAAPGELVARFFALPVVLVAGASAESRIPGVVGDVGEIQALLARGNALGPARNFGLSNALCSLEALQSVSPLALYRAVRELDPQSITAALAPQDVAVARGQEQAHLRFLAGASIGPSEAPGFAETGANIGSWGRECAQFIAARLATPGVQLLVVPRPPRDLLSAAEAGRWAQLDIAFNLFASNAVRRFRMSVGDPVAIVSAHEGGEVRITLSSPFADELVEGFRWPLHPSDVLDAIERQVLDLFADMRVTDVRVLPRVLPAERARGVPLHPRCAEWDAFAAGPVQH